MRARRKRVPYVTTQRDNPAFSRQLWFGAEIQR